MTTPKTKLPISIGGFQRPIRLGTFIRKHLEVAGTAGDYAYNVYRTYKKILKTEIPKAVKKYKIPSYRSFLNYWYILRRLENIVPVMIRGKHKTKKGTYPHTMDRKYYMINEKVIWYANPQKAYAMKFKIKSKPWMGSKYYTRIYPRPI